MMYEKLQFATIEGKVADFLKNYFITDFRPGYVNCKNVVLPEYFRCFGDIIQEMDIRPDDIWVCSFPKSGTTWTQEMVWCIANDVNLEAAQEFLPKRFPFLDHSPLFDYRQLMSRRPELEFPDYVLDSVSYINNLESPRFIKTHLPYQLLPQKLQSNQTPAKIIYVARNSRDTCVSYYHHCKLLEGYKGDFETFCNLFLQGAVCFGPFWDHVLGYWDKRNNTNVLFITYEDMKQDLRSVIKKTSKFLGKSLSEEKMDDLLVHLSFENMKQNRAVNYEPVIEINKKYNLIEEDGTFMRCGKVGEWKEHMTPNIIDTFSDWDNKYLKNSDFESFSNSNA